MIEDMPESNKQELFHGKNVLFITTKNIDYIRNSQELNYLEKYSKNVETVHSTKKSYLARIFSIYFQLLFLNCRKFDMIFIGFAPQLILPIFHRKFQSKVYIDFFISVYDTFVNDRKKIKENNILARFCKWLDKKTLTLADKIIVDTKAHGKYFVEEFGISEEKLNVLYLLANEKIYYPKEMKKKKQLKDKFVVLYFGSILPLQGVEVIQNAINLLGKEEDIWFQIIGPVKEKIANGNNVEYISWLSQEELSDYIANADLCLAGHFNKEIGKANRTIPGKAYIYEAMRKKIVLGNSEANQELFKKDDRHLFVEMGNPEKLADLIMNQKNKWEI